jgi:hypothetical protein
MDPLRKSVVKIEPNETNDPLKMKNPVKTKMLNLPSMESDRKVYPDSKRVKIERKPFSETKQSNDPLSRRKDPKGLFDMKAKIEKLDDPLAREPVDKKRSSRVEISQMDIKNYIFKVKDFFPKVIYKSFREQVSKFKTNDVTKEVLIELVGDLFLDKAIELDIGSRIKLFEEFELFFGNKYNHLFRKKVKDMTKREII